MTSSLHFRSNCAAVAALTLCLLLAERVVGQAADTSTSRISDIRQRFANPPDDARIMMRWWWFGSAVQKRELERELQTMKDGGIGGVEVQPVYPLELDGPGHGIKNLPYLSHEFLDMLHFASEKARELGLRFDLTLGSGWPYGGPKVPISQAAGCLRITRISVGSAQQRIPLPDMVDGEKFLGAFLGQSSSQSANKWAEITDIHDGVLSLPPAAVEKREILFFIASRTGMMVKRAAVGAEGFVVDHYDEAALQRYLQNVGDPLMRALSDHPPYAVFCDSLEVYNSDWTSDFLEQFATRRGYDLRSHLPDLIDDSGPQSAEIRHDWGETLSELFNERFVSPLHEWARASRTRLRMQAYGIPPAELSSNALADLPEGEGSAWRELAATRWAASASHIYGVPITSSETWTWLHSPVFRATPLDMKAEADRHFLQGINQLIGHGWPYTPENVTYPGWRFYAAAVFDEKNPWWLVMPDIAKYLQRISYLLRQGQPISDVAVYLPTDDAWGDFRPGKVDLFETLKARLGTTIISSILSAGFNLDFFDDDALRHVGRIENHKLVLGSNRYQAVVLPAVERIPLDTYQKLEAFAANGGVLVATKRLPERVPGFRAGDAEQEQLRQISERLFHEAHAALLIQDETQLGNKLSSLTMLDVSLSPAAPEIGFVHRTIPEGEIYFLANTGSSRETSTATFRVTQLQPQWWDPISGKVSTATPKGRTATGISVDIDLQPYASRFLVFSKQILPADVHPAVPSKTIDISGEWRVSFTDQPTILMGALHSWTADKQTQYFSGIATYEKSVSVSEALLAKGNSVQIDLGEGKQIPSHELRVGTQAWLDPPVREAAVVYVNGQRAGSLWSPPYSLDITKLLHSGENNFKIEVANLALNYMAGKGLPDYRLLNLRYGTRFEAQDMDKVQPIPAGLLGSIRLISSAAR